MSQSGAYRLELSGVTKAFPGVLANDHVSFAVLPGEIHALLGENGAGKSTLVKMIYGVLQPDDGRDPLRRRAGAHPEPARRAGMGIGMVFQHFSLFEAMTVLENIALGFDEKLGAGRAREANPRGADPLRPDPRPAPHRLDALGRRAAADRDRPRAALQPEAADHGRADPVLTPQEVTQLFETLRSLAAGGCSILYISHKLHEIKALCDGATILRGGKVVGDCVPAKESSRSMAEMMIGGSLKDIKKAEGRVPGPEKFAVEGLSLAGSGGFDVALKDIRFSVRAGRNPRHRRGGGQRPERAGAGAGRRDAVGESPAPSGSTASRWARCRSPTGAAAVSARCPRSATATARCRASASPTTRVLTARNRKGMVRHGVISSAAARGFAEEVIRAFAVKATGPAALAGSLSGGNLQKFIMGREVLQTPEVLVVSQPTWGVDAGAAAAIHQALVDLAARGSAIVVISQDLDELLALCDSLAVINEGRLSPKRAIGEISIEEIGMLMGGVHGEADHGATSRHGYLDLEISMLIELEKRREPSPAMVYLTPVLAVLLTMVVGAVVFSSSASTASPRSGRFSSSRWSTRAPGRISASRRRR